MNKVVLLDLDGTLISGQSQVLFIKYLFLKGKINLKTYLKVFYWYFKYKYLINEIDTNLAKDIYNKFIGGLKVSDLSKLVDEFVEQVLLKKIKTGVLNKVNSLKKENCSVVLVSASIEPIVSKVTEILKFDDYLATELEIKDLRFSGKVLGEINEGENKKIKILERLNIEKCEYAISDSVSDIVLFQMASYPIVVSPNKKLRLLAKNNGWEIINT